MAGKVVELAVVAGDKVAEGQKVMSTEAMKMLNVIKAPAAGTVARILVQKGDEVSPGDLVVRNHSPIRDPIAAESRQGPVTASASCRKLAAVCGVCPSLFFISLIGGKNMAKAVFCMVNSQDHAELIVNHLKRRRLPRGLHFRHPAGP